MLKDKIILVTGASRGIGRAIALQCAGQGAQVIIDYVAGEQEAAALGDEIVQQGSKAILFRADVSKEEDVKGLFAMIKSDFGRIDALVNNAGIALGNPIMLATNDEFQRMVAVNCLGTFLCTQYASRLMMRQGSGTIVNISSIYGINGIAGQSLYSATKAFVIGFTRSAAKELGRYGITVNAVAPGLIDTDLTRSAKKEVIDKIISNNPIGRIGSPEDVAGVVLFLCSGLAGYVTGQVICVDGGQVI